jgi:hypothetical protein
MARMIEKPKPSRINRITAPVPATDVSSYCRDLDVGRAPGWDWKKTFHPANNC